MKNLTRKLGALALAGALIIPSSTNAAEVLTSSARDYVESAGKSLKDYTMKGVNDVFVGDTRTSKGCSFKLLKKIPESAEVVVDYKFSITSRGGNWSYTECSGTALIPKK